MENLHIDGEKNVYFKPTVDFNAETGICEITGESYLEETIEFYNPIIKWLEEYTRTTQQLILFNFKLNYFNTSSSRSIVDILLVLKEYEENNGTIEVNWYYNPHEVDIEDIEDFIEETGVNINIIETLK